MRQRARFLHGDHGTGHHMINRVVPVFIPVIDFAGTLTPGEGRSGPWAWRAISVRMGLSTYAHTPTDCLARSEVGMWDRFSQSQPSDYRSPHGPTPMPEIGLGSLSWTLIALPSRPGLRGWSVRARADGRHWELACAVTVCGTYRHDRVASTRHRDPAQGQPAR